MTIQNSTLKRIGLVALSLAVVLGLGFVAWKGREAYLANNARIASLESNLASEKANGESLTTQLASKDAELTATNEKYGVAVSEKSAAETAKAKADADAADAKKKATTASNEAVWQKGQADQANGNLATCNDNKASLANVVITIDKQKNYYYQSGQFVARATSSYLAGDYAGAINLMETAQWYSEQASGLQPTVTYWLDQIE